MEMTKYGVQHTMKTDTKTEKQIQNVHVHV